MRKTVNGLSCDGAPGGAVRQLPRRRREIDFGQVGPGVFMSAHKRKVFHHNVM
jgi:hypothetical protein